MEGFTALVARVAEARGLWEAAAKDVYEAEKALVSLGGVWAKRFLPVTLEDALQGPRQDDDAQAEATAAKARAARRHLENCRVRNRAAYVAWLDCRARVIAEEAAAVSAAYLATLPSEEAAARIRAFQDCVSRKP